MFNLGKLFGPDSCKAKVKALMTENKAKSDRIVNLISNNKELIVQRMTTPNEQLRKQGLL